MANNCFEIDNVHIVLSDILGIRNITPALAHSVHT